MPGAWYLILQVSRKWHARHGTSHSVRHHNVLTRIHHHALIPGISHDCLLTHYHLLSHGGVHILHRRHSAVHLGVLDRKLVGHLLAHVRMLSHLRHAPHHVTLHHLWVTGHRHLHLIESRLAWGHSVRVPWVPGIPHRMTMG